MSLNVGDRVVVRHKPWQKLASWMRKVSAEVMSDPTDDHVTVRLDGELNCRSFRVSEVTRIKGVE